jgi:hypothetical protein
MYGYESCWDMFSVIRHFMREPNTLKPKQGTSLKLRRWGMQAPKTLCHACAVIVPRRTYQEALDFLVSNSVASNA